MIDPPRMTKLLSASQHKLVFFCHEKKKIKVCKSEKKLVQIFQGHLLSTFGLYFPADNNLLLTEQEGCTGEHWPKIHVMAILN